MIRNSEAQRRDDEADRWTRLRRMSAAESIAIGEALLTSEIMNLAVSADDDHPRSLGIANRKRAFQSAVGGGAE